MIYIRFYRKGSQGDIHMVMDGHAGAAPKGEDLICAAASMLCYTAGQAVQFLWEQGKLKCRPKIQIREGRAVIIATPKKEAEAETLYLFWVVQAGAWVLARNYPRFVRTFPISLEEKREEP